MLAFERLPERRGADERDKMKATKAPISRSENMSRIRGKDTKPEMKVRRLVHGLSFRYRLHRRDLPGSPDLAFPGRRVAIFVHGCFWHRHIGCANCTTPKSRVEFWTDKFAKNVERDRRAISDLERLGWRVMTIWECETEGSGTDLGARVASFLNNQA